MAKSKSNARNCKTRQSGSQQTNTDQSAAGRRPHPEPPPLLLLSREDFERFVFRRDGGKCLLCDEPAVDAHHILERKLFTDPCQKGGYFLENGASVCQHHHLRVEMTKISCGRIRQIAGISRIVLPDGWNPNRIYDKWGNLVHVPASALPSDDTVDNDDDAESTYPRRPGPMFHSDNVQKIMKKGDMMFVFDIPLTETNPVCMKK